MSTREPTYVSLAGQIRRRILSGEIAVGESIPSRSQLAIEYGAAKATVDRAVSDLMRDGFLESRPGSGTFVRNRESQVGGQVFCLVSRAPAVPSDAPGMYYGPLLSGVHAAAHVADCHLGFQQASSLRDYDRILALRRYAGLLVLRPTEQDLPILEILRDRGVPFVAMPAWFEQGDIPCVAPDNVAGASLAVRHLIELGHVDIGLTCVAVHVPDHFLRFRGYQEEVSRAGLRIDPSWVMLAEEDRGERMGHILRDWLTRLRQLPTAIFCTDYSASLLVSLLHERGLRVPGDVSVVCFDDPPVPFTPALTAVGYSVHGLGCRAMEKLIDIVRTGDLGGQEVVPVKLTVRETTAPPQRPC